MLPDDVLLEIFRLALTDIATAVSAMVVCRYWNALVVEQVELFVLAIFHLQSRMRRVNTVYLNDSEENRDSYILERGREAFAIKAALSIVYKNYVKGKDAKRAFKHIAILPLGLIPKMKGVPRVELIEEYYKPIVFALAELLTKESSGVKELAEMLVDRWSESEEKGKWERLMCLYAYYYFEKSEDCVNEVFLAIIEKTGVPNHLSHNLLNELRNYEKKTCCLQ